MRSRTAPTAGAPGGRRRSRCASTPGTRSSPGCSRAATTCARSRGRRAWSTDEFDLVVSMTTREGYGPDDGVEHHVARMADAGVDAGIAARVDELAGRRRRGRRRRPTGAGAVLRRAQPLGPGRRVGAGAARPCARRGDRAGAPRRGPWALTNPAFVTHLRGSDRRPGGGCPDHRTPCKHADTHLCSFEESARVLQVPTCRRCRHRHRGRTHPRPRRHRELQLARRSSGADGKKAYAALAKKKDYVKVDLLAINDFHGQLEVVPSTQLQRPDQQHPRGRRRLPRLAAEGGAEEVQGRGRHADHRRRRRPDRRHARCSRPRSTTSPPSRP